MKLVAKEIPLFKDLLQFDLEQNHYDLHNDYDCVGVENRDFVLTIKMKKISTGVLLFLEFFNVDIVGFDVFFEETLSMKTIDSLYRGRHEQNSLLKEFYEQKGFFYMEFDEGCKIEFWAEDMCYRTKMK